MYRVQGGTRGSETSQYPQEEKTTCDSVSSGERKRRRLNLRRVKLAGVAVWGLWDVPVGALPGFRWVCVVLAEGFWKGPAERVRPPYAKAPCTPVGCVPE